MAEHARARENLPSESIHAIEKYCYRLKYEYTKTYAHERIQIYSSYGRKSKLVSLIVKFAKNLLKPLKRH